mgnify:CR=1 FL=1
MSPQYHPEIGGLLGGLFIASGSTWARRTFEPVGFDLEERGAGLWVYHARQETCVRQALHTGERVHLSVWEAVKGCTP